MQNGRMSIAAHSWAILFFCVYCICVCACIGAGVHFCRTAFKYTGDRTPRGDPPAPNEGFVQHSRLTFPLPELGRRVCFA